MLHLFKRNVLHKNDARCQPLCQMRKDQVVGASEALDCHRGISDQLGVTQIPIHGPAETVLHVVSSTGCHHHKLCEPKNLDSHIASQWVKGGRGHLMPLPPYTLIGCDAEPVKAVVFDGTACVTHLPQGQPIPEAGLENRMACLTMLQGKWLLQEHPGTPLAC